MTFILDVIQVFVSIMLVVLILMHSGKDTEPVRRVRRRHEAQAGPSAVAHWSNAT